MNRSLFLSTLILVASASSQTAEWPTRASRSFSSNFGENRDDHFHMGLDIKTRGTTGHEVVSSHNGYISRMVSNYSGYGKALYIKTTSGNEIVYAHLEKFIPVLEKVWRLQQAKRRSYIVNANFSSREFQIKKGDLIGYSGNTGSSFAPHIHYEYRTPNSEPLNPLVFAFDLPDNVTPIPKNIALVPLSQETLINANPLVQIFPLYRDRSGVYYFADTLSVFGEFGFAIEVIDKRQGANNIYQFHRAELIFDRKKKFEIRYDKISFSEGKHANTIINYSLKRKNLGEYQKLYRLSEHPKMSLHRTVESGIIRPHPGFHSVEINIYDAAGNKASIQGVIAGTFPMAVDVQEILRNDMVITLNISPKRGGLPIRDAVIYGFTPYGLPDKKIEFLQSEQVKKDLHITIPLREIKNQNLQILAINQIGGMAEPFHWSILESKYSVIDIMPDLEVQGAERGVFFQVEIDQYVPANVSIKLADNNTFKSYPINQIQPNVFLSEMLPHKVLTGIKYIDVELSHEGLSRETRFHFRASVAEPGKETVVLSEDKNCSIQILPETLYQTNAVWIEKVKKYAPVKEGFHLSPVYQLQPFNIPLRGEFKVGIRYDFELVEHSNLGIYYFNNKDEKWTYVSTQNNRKKQILSASLAQLDAVTIIQDLEPPIILSMHPGNGAGYKIEDIKNIQIIVDDKISGIDAKEESFELSLNGHPLYFSYQPVKKEISYTLEQPLKDGPHQIDFKVSDRFGNTSSKSAFFSAH
mgnify:CR=1 FL=1